MTYFPLDRDILTSSLWAEGTPETFKVWAYLLLSADPRDGIVRDSIPGIALRCCLPLTDVETVLEFLSAPDKHSRTKDNDGRRISYVDDGILILNYSRKRDKDYSTPRVQRWRERHRERVETEKRVTETLETTNKNKNKNTEETPQTPHGGAELRDWYNTLTGRDVRSTDTFVARLKEGSKPATLKLAIVGVMLQPFYLGNNERTKEYLDPVTMMRRERVAGHADIGAVATYKTQGVAEAGKFWAERWQVGEWAALERIFRSRDEALRELGKPIIGPAAIRADVQVGRDW